MGCVMWFIKKNTSTLCKIFTAILILIAIIAIPFLSRQIGLLFSYIVFQQNLTTGYPINKNISLSDIENPNHDITCTYYNIENCGMLGFGVLFLLILFICAILVGCLCLYYYIIDQNKVYNQENL